METVEYLVKSRIIETKNVAADDLELHPMNWRVHPNEQIETVEGILREVGIVQTLVAYYSERNGGKLTLIDGHLRKGLGGLWPVTITDLNDQEADLILATLHPSGDMAQVDDANLAALLSGVNMKAIESESLKDLLLRLSQTTPAEFDDGNAPEATSENPAEGVQGFTREQVGPHVRMVQLFFNEDSIQEFNRLTLELAKRYGTATLTETVMEAARRESITSQAALQ